MVLSLVMLSMRLRGGGGGRGETREVKPKREGTSEK